jgi:2-keto-4-pentenoate hydratase/2-oxohepta-3-ene-1,7-dioic acid hydratase in catechol pathway
MKIIRYNNGRIGVVKGDQVHDVSVVVGAGENFWPPIEMNQLIRDFDKLRPKIESAAQASAPVPLSSVHLETPIPWPNKLMAYPVNYHDHAKEMSSVGFANVQGYFLKSNSSLIGASDRIELPNLPDRSVHHECELGIIIGKECRGATLENAMDYVFGYACLMDITIRGKEERVMRKSYDTFTPVGPWIVTADEITDPKNLHMQLWVNDELRQDANTSDLIVGLPEMIVVASSASTLYPGDIIATGTPAGVGPIVEGDIVTIEIEQVGRMSLPVVQGKLGSNFVFAPRQSNA